jgi:arginyl-tRNA synthetase
MSSPASTTPQHLFADMRARVRAAVAPLAPGADLARVSVEPPKDPTHGDMAYIAELVMSYVE